MDDHKALLSRWLCCAARSSKAHYEASRVNASVDNIFTIVNIIASIGVLALSLSLGASPELPEWIKGSSHWLLPLLSTIVVVSGVIQVIIDGRARSINFARAGAEFAAMARKIEQSMEEQTSLKDLTDIRKRLDNFARSAPVLRSWTWESDNEVAVK